MDLLHKAPIFAPGSLARMSHCATLTALPDGTLLAAWFAGSFETAPDQFIAMARLAPGQSDWEPPVVAVDTPYQADGQPVFLTDHGGVLWLYYVVVDGTTWTDARMMRRPSSDWGVHWGPAEALPFPPGRMFRSRPLHLGGGHWLFPCYDERTWRSWMMFSADDGRHWQAGPTIETPVGNIHPAVVRLADGRLLAYLRPGGKGGVLWQTDSRDEGRSWSRPEPTSIPNPNSGFDLLRLRSGRLLLANNPSRTRRSPLTVSASTDEGRTWQTEIVLEEGEGEYSYPWLLEDRAGRIHCLYTWRRQTIMHAVLG